MVSRTRRLTKKQQRQSDREQTSQLMKFPTMTQLHLSLRDVGPITDNQITTFNAYDDGDNILLHGCAGTGKTFISMYLALNEIANARSSRRKLVIIRTAQSSKDIGFLPGDEKRKLEVYEAAYKAICTELYNRADAYEILKQKGIIEFHGTSFLRGTTIDDAIILVDEVQNQRYNEIRTVLTRTGDNSRVVLCGDTKQDDLTSERFKETSGLVDIMKVFQKMNDMTSVEFGIDDIVRSGFVRDFIIAENELGLY